MTDKEIIKKLKKKIITLKKEITNLNAFLSEADDGGWDGEGLYTDARDGLFNGNEIDGMKPDKEYAKWIANRYSLEIDKDGEILKEESQ